MHAVAPRTGPDEINVAEEQHEYRQLVAAPYMLDYAEGRPPAYTLLTRWRCTDDDLALLLGVDVEAVRAIQSIRKREDIHLGILTFGQPLQPINIQVGPCSPTDWRTGDVEGLPRAVARPQTGPNPVMSAEDWQAAGAQVERGKDADVHKCVIALSNHALADDDPQKVTHEHVDLLRSAARQFDTPGMVELLALANLLDNYLPPR